ncbi:unannotated protein [freshwater metagenome]|uniref:Unannotated protein n=1 Tax=freshwater metagenome TaxID=449393 RepID=A0A6J6M607_9ZZZZ|nr:hypothetical protein [Actinomycetota bacterium]
MSEERSIYESLIHWLRPHRTIPVTPWRARHRWDVSPLRIAILTLGLAFFGVGEALLVQSHLGNSPWVVFAQGVQLKSGLSLGWATFYISCSVLLLWIPLRERPGLGTILNIIVIALFLQIGVDHIPMQSNFWLGLVFALLGIASVGVASALYITCGLGPGPRDGLMTGIHQKTGIRVGRVRLGIEALVLVVGGLLGGRIGLGTALFAGLIGQSVAISCGILARLTRQ